MKEIKILLIISFFVGILYYGVEPFAHHQMHPHTADADYEFSDLKLGDKLICTSSQYKTSLPVIESVVIGQASMHGASLHKKHVIGTSTSGL